MASGENICGNIKRSFLRAKKPKRKIKRHEKLWYGLRLKPLSFCWIQSWIIFVILLTHAVSDIAKIVNYFVFRQLKEASQKSIDTGSVYYSIILINTMFIKYIFLCIIQALVAQRLDYFVGSALSTFQTTQAR